MAFEPFGGTIWSDEPAAPVNPLQDQLLKLGIAGASSGALLYAASRSGNPNWNPIDSAVEAAALGGRLSPFGLLNTFRVPEFLSPLSSVTHQGLTTDLPGLAEGKFGHRWDQEFLKSHDTQKYLKVVTGLDDSALAAAGIRPGMVGAENELARELIFERTAGSPRGSLYTIVGNEKRTLSSAVSLMRMTRDSPDLLDKQRVLNRAAFGVFQALDMWQHEGFDAKKVFRSPHMSAKRLEEAGIKPSQWMPVPSMEGPLTSTADLGRRTALPRAIPAFEMERFNRLASGFVHQALGPAGESAFQKLTGLGIETMPGPASNTFGRIGLRVAALGAGIMGVQQLDWARRNYNAPGELMASATLSAGIGFATSKLTGSPKTAVFAGVASFFGQMILPGFDQGVVPGMATVYTRANTLRASDWNPMNYQRRTLEGYVPGSTDWKTGALLGIGVALGSALRMPFTEDRIPQYLMNTFGHQRLGLPKGVLIDGAKGTYTTNVRTPPTARDIFWKKLVNDAEVRSNLFGIDKLGNATGWTQRTQLSAKLLMESEKFGGVHKLMSKANALWASAEEVHRSQAKENPLNKALLMRLSDINKTYKGTDFLSRLRKEAVGFSAQSYHSFFGAVPTEEVTAAAIRSMGFGYLHLPDVGLGAARRLSVGPTGRLGGMLSLGLATFGMHQLATGGLLGSMESAEELEDLYSGKQLVEVKRGRWWSGGGTAFEGDESGSYFRPHAYHLMMNRVREKGIWGEGEDEISPIQKFITKNFTYDLEMMNYYDRPYPITSAAFQDIPLIGGVLAATVGRLIKPPKLMHVNEWIREGQDGDLEYGSVYEGWRREPSYALGAAKPGIPQTNLDLRQQMAFLSYQNRELAGLTGYARSILTDLITGEDTFNTDSPVLADAGQMTSPRMRFWESNQGGLFMTNEAIRRILPRQRSEIERQNPILNDMPTWLPNKYKKGDPFRVIEWGESRLPGEGYAALHPELKGVDPEEYPAIYRYAILGDVAQHSREFRQQRVALYRRRASGQTSEAENAWMDAIDAQVRKKINRKEFDAVHEAAIELPGAGITQAMTAAAKVALRKAAAPFEYLVPMGFRPVQKLMGSDRNPIEQYEYERLYGTSVSYWDEPWRDWFRPALYSAANLLGFEGKPEWRREADANQEYFDKLEFTKWMKLAEQAGAQGDMKQKNRYMYMASSTRTGVNPQGNPLSIYWSIPDKDRAFFNAFSHATGTDRERILEMVPEDQVHLYKAVWERMDKGDPGMWAGSSTSVDDQYLTQRFYEMEDYFRYNPEPPTDWVGWHEDVDIGDIQVRYIDQLGKDLHDFGKHESQVKAAYGQEYLEGSTNFLPVTGGVGRGGLWSQIRALSGGHVTVHTNQSFSNHSNVQYNDDRTDLIRHKLREYQGGY